MTALRLTLVGFVALWLGAATTVVQDRLPDPEQEAKARAIMEELRCLVCQNQSIAESDAPLAADLRQIVREHVAAGEDADTVKAYLVERYCDWVLLKPPVKANTLLLWGGPIIFVVIGIWVLVVAARKWRHLPDLEEDEDTP